MALPKMAKMVMMLEIVKESPMKNQQRRKFQARKLDLLPMKFKLTTTLSVWNKTISILI
jgi:hypothetical protein